MLDHPLSGIVGEAPLHLAGGVAHFGQVAGCVKAIAGEYFAVLVGVQAFYLGHAVAFANQLDLHQIEGVAQSHQASGVVIVEIDAVVITIAQLAKAQCR
ncbi:hypothetical protein PS676_05712 [Pseudomonas fluorescens]|nr:hypothetical protein PS676_05712 [Pseudomonas fluorescens]